MAEGGLSAAEGQGRPAVVVISADVYSRSRTVSHGGRSEGDHEIPIRESVSKAYLCSALSTVLEKGDPRSPRSPYQTEDSSVRIFSWIGDGASVGRDASHEGPVVRSVSIEGVYKSGGRSR